MKSTALGKNTSGPEITHISAQGVWLLAAGREMFMPYDDFPWFKAASVAQILNVSEPAPGHFHWPDLDMDLTPEIIEHPQRFPLKAR